jgi:DNA-binding MarR family transcriptional regulator
MMVIASSPPAGDGAPDLDLEAALAARLRLAVTRLHRVLRQQVAGGLTPSQIATLSAAERLGAPTLGELAAAEQVQPPSMTRIVGVLEAAGMLERRLDPLDRRVVRVEVTGDGHRALERIRSMRNALVARRLRRLGLEERRQLGDLVTLLERLVDS